MKYYIGEQIAEAALEIQAIKLFKMGIDPTPFLWASNFYMPIYNDNRMLLNNPEHRHLVRDGFIKILKDVNTIDAIAGTTTSGIAPAAAVADKLEKDLIILHNG